MEITIGLKMPVGDVSAQAAMMVKKSTGLSLAEIKRRTADDEFIIECPVADDDGLKAINRLARELRKLDVQVRLFETGREETLASFDALEKLHKEIDETYGAYDDEF